MTKGLKINLMVQKCLMAAYAYYVLDETIMPDHEYDFLCKTLHENYDKITHEHKYLLGYDKENSLLMNFDIKWESAPRIIKEATKQYLQEKKC
jgi:uncharacterized protein involved in tolerance to divalent cations